MYVCRSCGNYYEFSGSAIAKARNATYSTGRDKFEESIDIMYEPLDFISCSECGGNDVTEVDINTLPKMMREEIYNTIIAGCVDLAIMVDLKEIAKKEVK